MSGGGRRKDGHCLVGGSDLGKRCEVGRRVQTGRMHVMDSSVRPGMCPVFRTLGVTRRGRLSLIRVSPGTRPPIYHVVSCSGFLCRRGGHRGRRGTGRIGIGMGRVHFKPRASSRSCGFGLGRTGKFLRSNSGIGTCMFFGKHSVLFGRRNRILLLHFTGSLRSCTGMSRLPILRKGHVVVRLSPGGGRKASGGPTTPGMITPGITTPGTDRRPARRWREGTWHTECDTLPCGLVVWGRMEYRE